jgi:hypothetical protein
MNINVALVIADAIRDLKQVPSGHLYARVMHHLNIHQYNAVIDALKRARLVTEDNYLLTWVGPPATR